MPKSERQAREWTRKIFFTGALTALGHLEKSMREGGEAHTVQVSRELKAELDEFLDAFAENIPEPIQ